ncbi:MAG: hypothetical protein AB2672_19820 [Candidatus Thiodiazotropha endolucinida]|uniref:Uncharacterized protein n=1 Tax=Candidatus Thiodiazotropha endolucinida TaxID=1655433 RepID=A0A7Z0VJ81_9GAMM|nr:hypothetical protein [Candidatus Thiodiazotropha endolucinida]MBT3032244.1 hypothetical protein [Candidatus Thiodiazotropha sp. (ex Lucina pensylvanica)]MBT3040495.1 hypothetical protein [Candidatus Thiodiazotropha sp. (ex Codakia orbicularis)]MBV2126270.1 hypothetical protein [Candidatus Thiodiazotropha taylori]MBT3043547.1 hypothetical protein [Candidatus Thiodiazotropha sp. (ex Codakia orbicularis)]MBT3052164.1 hypothetical protein [Candidatus Thiodiazotropha sp. (ex Codakia orbicularis)
MAQQKPKVKKRAGKVIHSAVSQHALEKAKEIRTRYGDEIDYRTVLSMLEDRKSVRYPVNIRFVSEGIEPGMFGKTEPVSDNPEDGYTILLHSYYKNRHDDIPALILYQLVLVNYGDLATANDAEIFGATVLGMDRDAYYNQIASLVDAAWGC